MGFRSFLVAVFSVSVLSVSSAQDTPLIVAPLDPSGVGIAQPSLADLIEKQTLSRVLEPLQSAPANVCCRIDENVDQYALTSANECREDLVVPVGQCTAEVQCCCAYDDGPGTPGTSILAKDCNTNVCKPGEQDLSRPGEPNACKISTAHLPRTPTKLGDNSYNVGLVDRLRRIARGIGWSTSGLCAADRLKPGEKCRDLIMCGVGPNGNVSCSACDNGDCIPITPPGSTPPPTSANCKGNKQVGYEFCASCIWAPKKIYQFRNSLSRYYSSFNTSDMKAKQFYNLSSGNTDVAVKIDLLWNSLKPNVKNNFFDEILERDKTIFTLISNPLGNVYQKCAKHIASCGNDNFCYARYEKPGGGYGAQYIDEWKRLYAETLDSEFLRFKAAAQSISDPKMKTAVLQFIDDSRNFIGTLALNNITGTQGAIPPLEAAQRSIGQQRDQIMQYARQNP